MYKKSFVLIIGLLFLCSCGQKKDNRNTQELSEEKVMDSIKSILVSISDKWEFVNSKNTSHHKFSLPEIDQIKIEHWAKINSNEPTNELSITGMDFQYIDSTNTMNGKSYDYPAVVEYRNKKFGLNIMSEFIGISVLNETSLLFDNGQQFERKQ